MVAGIEALLGNVPLPNIPAIIIALWRVDSIFLNVGVSLVLSATWSRHRAYDDGPFLAAAHSLPIFLPVAAAHAAVTLGWLWGMRSLGGEFLRSLPSRPLSSRLPR